MTYSTPKFLKDIIDEGYWITVVSFGKQIYSGNDPDLAYENIITLEECACTFKKSGVPDERLIINVESGNQLLFIIDKDESWIKNWALSNMQKVIST